MNYTFKNKHTDVPILTIGLAFSKNKKFHIKPEWVSHLDNLHLLKYGENSGYVSTSFFVPTTFQLFWLKFCFYIKIHKQELTTGQKYTNYELSYEQVFKKKLEEEQNFLNKPSNFFKGVIE
jgi:hypothetical protein